MVALFTHLTAVERLAARVNSLPPDFARPLAENLEYARFGAALPALPWFGGWTLALGAVVGRGDPPVFSRALMERAPVSFGLKAAELVANGALVGTDAGLAFVAGYFTQLCVARALEPLVQQLVITHSRKGELPRDARHRIEWIQSLFLMQDLHGGPLVGTAAIRTRLQVRKGGPFRGVGRGMYELVRVCSQAAMGLPLGKHEVDGWVNGLTVYSLVLASPVGRITVPGRSHLSQKELYRGPGVDVFAVVDHGLDLAREVLAYVGGMVRKFNFSPRARARLLEIFPEGSPAAVVRVQAA